jgi:HAD superfamily hydrolase (TIGR01484 family)
MRYLALVTDYDGTLAEGGRVGPRTVEALRQLRESGRRLLLVTGRELADLLALFPEHALFDRIVAENGALFWAPDTREERLLAEPPPPKLVERLKQRGVSPLSVGKVIVATWEPHEATVLEAIHDLGLEHQVIFNKGAVMILPSGINKATGLRAALSDLGLSPHNAVAVGDAENDHTLLAECEAGVAVQNALPMLKERADWVTEGARGDGVVELAQRVLASDLGELEPRLGRHDIALGKTPAGKDVVVHAYGPRILVCGASGSGKSTLAAGFLERLCQAGYRYCLIDPEGDFTNAPSAIVVGDRHKEPTVDEIVNVLRTGEGSLVANLMGVPLAQRPLFLGPVLARLAENRIRFGVPHWIIVDEAHHMMPEGDVTLSDSVTNVAPGVLLVTVHPERLVTSVLRKIDELFVVGKSADGALRAFMERAGVESVNAPLREPSGVVELAPGEAFHWSRSKPSLLERFRVLPPKAERRRHERKYASGDLGEDKSFYFRGPEGTLNLRANNLALFLQMAEGVDDATWLHHLVSHDYSRWLKDSIKNDELASSVFAIEAGSVADARESRRQVRSAIERVYTLPA